VQHCCDPCVRFYELLLSRTSRTRADDWLRPWVAGISGGPDGCYSVALSGGYEDDVDLGEGLYVPFLALLPRSCPLNVNWQHIYRLW
jgi:hypothetical protein